ncbi:MAG: hypothetical protein WCI60_02900 [bacterium]
MTTKKTTKKASKFRDYINKKRLIRLGIALSLTANLIIAVIVVLAVVQSYQGKINSLTTNSALFSRTCLKYYSKQHLYNGKVTNVDGVRFQPIYINDTSLNICNEDMFSSQIAQKWLLLANRQNAINYYVNTTKLNSGLFGPNTKEEIDLPIFYDAKTGKPINLDTFHTYKP